MRSSETVYLCRKIVAYYCSVTNTINGDSEVIYHLFRNRPDSTVLDKVFQWITQSSKKTISHLGRMATTHTVTRERGAPPTSSIELHPYSPKSSNIAHANKIGDTSTLLNGNVLGGGDVRDNLPPPSTAATVVQQWNIPRSNMWRVFASFFSMMVSGLNDAAYGVRTAEMFEHYGLTL